MVVAYLRNRFSGHRTWVPDGGAVLVPDGHDLLLGADEEATVPQPSDTEAQKQRERDRLLAVARFGITVNTMGWTPERVVEAALERAKEDGMVGQRHGYEGPSVDEPIVQPLATLRDLNETLCRIEALVLALVNR